MPRKRDQILILAAPQRDYNPAMPQTTERDNRERRHSNQQSQSWLVPKSWEHAAKKAGAQVKKECKLTTVPAEAGYRHLYLLEVNRRAKKIMHNRERRSKRRENRRTGQATCSTGTFHGIDLQAHYFTYQISV